MEYIFIAFLLSALAIGLGFLYLFSIKKTTKVYENKDVVSDVESFLKQLDDFEKEGVKYPVGNSFKRYGLTYSTVNDYIIINLYYNIDKKGLPSLQKFYHTWKESKEVRNEIIVSIYYQARSWSYLLTIKEK